MREGGVSWELHHADCCDLLPTMADDSFDHVITDPPYDERTHANAKREDRDGAAVKVHPATCGGQK
jgi:DNA modification methylase